MYVYIKIYMVGMFLNIYKHVVYVVLYATYYTTVMILIITAYK